MAISSDELKTIAATSAIAAAGGALATALVTYAVDRWVLKSEESTEPMFVVVPVVEREIPPLPPSEPPVLPPTPPEPPPQIAGYGVPFGALTELDKQEIHKLLPMRWWDEFHKCWWEEDPNYANFGNCRKLAQMYDSMSEHEQEQMKTIVDEGTPLVSRAETMMYMAIAGGAGIAIGMGVGMLMTR